MRILLARQTNIDGATSWEREYDTVTKTTIVTDPVAYATPYLRGGANRTATLFIDAFQDGTSVKVATYRLANSPISTRFEIVTYQNKKLLSFKPYPNGTVTIKMFDTVLKEETVLNSTTDDSPLASGRNVINNSFVDTSFDVLNTQCINTNQYIHTVNGAGGVALIVNYNSPSCGFTIATNGTILTETKTINVLETCDNDSSETMLLWRNMLGGYDQYLFKGGKQLSAEVDFGNQTMPYSFSNLTPIINSKQVAKLEETFKIGCDTLNENDYNGIVPHLIVSREIYILKRDGSREAVSIVGSEQVFDKKNKIGSVELEIKLNNKTTS